MKLEFESNAVSSPLLNNPAPESFDAKHDSSEVEQMLRDGIAMAQNGERAEARTLLLRVTEDDPKNENAWLWLASISEYPEELLVFLNNVLAINPENERALEWAKATKALIAKTFVQRGIEAAKEKQTKFAKQCFLQAIVHDAESELAWLWLASVSESVEEKMSHLHKVLSINPENENAMTSLKLARENAAKANLKKANAAAIAGDKGRANDVLAEIINDAPNFEDAWMLKAHLADSIIDKLNAFKRVLEINPNNPVAKANIDSLKSFVGSVGEFHNEEENAVEESVQEAVEETPAEFEARADEQFEVAEPEAVVEQHEEEPAMEMAAESEDPAQLEAAREEAQQEEPVEAAEEVDFESTAEMMPFEAEAEHVEESVPYEEVAENLEAEEAVELQADFDAEDDADEVSLEFDAEEAPVVEVQAAVAEEAVSEIAEDVKFEGESEVETQEEAHVEVDHSYEFADFQPEAVENNEYEAEAAEPLEEEAEAQEMAAESEPAAENVYQFESNDGFSAEEEEVMHEPGHVEFEVVEESNEEDGYFEKANAGFEPAMPAFEGNHDFSPELPGQNAHRISECPYCGTENDNQAFACHGCKALFTISDAEVLLSHDKADSGVISEALQRMESDKSLRGVDAASLKAMGIGYLNLKDYKKGVEYLQEAVQKDPEDVVLASQLDSLAIRLAEVEEHERNHDTPVAAKRILVVDDSPTVRKLISGKLEKSGHEAICAVDGMDALAKINEVIPDLILLDITMPRMDGYQVCKLIRSNEATKDVPVVMISGKDGFFDKVRGRMAGTSNYITKPFGPETLMKTVKEYIQ
ncbi:MAG: response regulator [Pyrinomonadaceae bacterium]